MSEHNIAKVKEQLKDLLQIMKDNLLPQYAEARVGHIPLFVVDTKYGTTAYVSGYIAALINDLHDIMEQSLNDGSLEKSESNIELIEIAHEDMSKGELYFIWPIVLKNDTYHVTFHKHAKGNAYVIGDIFTNHESRIQQAFTSLMQKYNISKGKLFGGDDGEVVEPPTVRYS